MTARIVAATIIGATAITAAIVWIGWLAEPDPQAFYGGGKDHPVVRGDI